MRGPRLGDDHVVAPAAGREGRARSCRHSMSQRPRTPSCHPRRSGPIRTRGSPPPTDGLRRGAGGPETRSVSPGSSGDRSERTTRRKAPCPDAIPTADNVSRAFRGVDVPGGGYWAARPGPGLTSRREHDHRSMASRPRRHGRGPTSLRVGIDASPRRVTRFPEEPDRKSRKSCPRRIHPLRTGKTRCTSPLHPEHTPVQKVFQGAAGRGRFPRVGGGRSRPPVILRRSSPGTPSRRPVRDDSSDHAGSVEPSKVSP